MRLAPADSRVYWVARRGDGVTEGDGWRVANDENVVEGVIADNGEKGATVGETGLSKPGEKGL